MAMSETGGKIVHAVIEVETRARRQIPHEHLVAMLHPETFVEVVTNRCEQMRLVRVGRYARSWNGILLAEDPDVAVGDVRVLVDLAWLEMVLP